MAKPRRTPTIGSIIRERRIAANLTQQDLAKRCKWRSKTTVAHYEAGRTTPTVHNMIRIAKALRCAFQDLLP